MSHTASNPPVPKDLPIEQRFQFGENWSRFLTALDDDRIREAEKSLQEWLGAENLKDRTFLDIGCGSGLFSLAARRLGARVHSFDFDPNSVACATELRRRYFPDDATWTIQQGSVLDPEFLAKIPQHEIVYSWGVLHHTGHMWEALANAGDKVAVGGTLFIAIYNDQGRTSRGWHKVKRLYVGSPAFGKKMLQAVFLGRLWGPQILADTIKRGNPLRTWRGYKSVRGMSPWHDLVDWIGGYPFEVARPEEIFEFFQKRGFQLQKMRTCGGGLGCNEFVLKRSGSIAV